jgi:purine-binding chemotaxis protein CheW
MGWQSARSRSADERQREVLEQRAHALAQPVAPLAPLEDLTMVGFELGGASWALESRFVWEVFRPQRLVPLPGAPAPLMGVTSWRGSVLSVLDLRGVLGVRVFARDEPSHVLVLGTSHAVFGMLVEGPGEVGRFAREALLELPDRNALHREWILGATPSGSFALDGERLIRLFGV